MNRSYKSIWNEATGTFVAVAENVNTKGKRSSSVRKGGILAAVGALTLSATTAMAAVEIDNNGNTINFTGSSGSINFGAGGSITGLSNLTVAGTLTADQILVGNSAVVTTTELEEVKSSVQKNTDAINTNKNSIEDHEGRITANKNSIEDHEGRITANKNSIDEHGKRISVNETSIDEIKDSLETLGVDKERPGVKYFRAKSEKGDAQALGTDSVAIGPLAKAEGDNSLAVGHGANAKDENSVAIGNKALAEGKSNIALGDAAKIQSPDKAIENSMAIGTGATVSGNGSSSAVALGHEASATGASAVALGHGSSAGAAGTAIGKSAKAAGSAIAMGTAAFAGAGNALAFGNGARAATTGSIAIGAEAGKGTTETPPNQGGDETHHIAIGTQAGQNIVGNQTTSIGFGAGSGSKGNYSVAIGNLAGQGLEGHNNVSLGHHANKKEKTAGTTTHAVALGGNTVAHSNSTAVGDGAQARGDNSVALGKQAETIDDGIGGNGGGGVALGANAKATGASVALGQNSVAEASKGIGYFTGSNASGDRVNVVSVGNSGAERRIVNMADGSAATDAVNVRQLAGAQKNIADIIGVGTSFDESTGQLTGFKVGTTEFGTITEAFESIADGKLTQIDPNSLAVLYHGSDKNSIVLGGESGGTQIKNLKAGENDTDAVNVRQMRTEVDTKKTKYFSVNSKGDENRNNDGATADNAIAIGLNASATAESSIAMGLKTLTEKAAERSVAIGASIIVQQEHSVGIGNNVHAYGKSNVAIGDGTKTTGENSIAIGTGAVSNTKLPDNSITSTDNAISIGTKSNVTADDGIAVGRQSVSSNKRGMAFGQEAKARGIDSIATGTRAMATGTRAMATGHEAVASATDSTAMGTSAKASGEQSQALGFEADSSAADSIALGSNAVSGIASADLQNDPGLAQFNKNTIAIGKSAQATFQDAIATGTRAQATQQSAMASGTDAKATAKDASASGTNAEATAEGAMASGTGAKAKAKNAIAMGKGASAEGLDSIASGTTARAYREGSVALGRNAQAGQGIAKEGNGAVALGDNSGAFANNSVALGAGSATNNSYGTSTAAYSLIKNNDAAAGVVSIGKVGSERRILNVAGGEADTDGVNVAQLKAVDKLLTERGMNFSAESGIGPVHRNLGETLAIKGDGTNITTKTTADGINIELAKKLDLGAAGSVQMGDTLVNNGGLTITGGPSITKDGGINAGGKVISNVAEGVDGKDAVNVDQLKGQIGGVEKLGLNFAANTGNDIHRNLGQTLGIKGGITEAGTATSGENVITRTDADGNINIELAKDATFDSITTGNTVMNNAGVKVGENVFLTDKGLKAGDTLITNAGLTFNNSTVAVTAGGINAGGKVISNVAPGVDGKDAVNVDQLKDQIGGVEKLGLNFAANTGNDIHRNLGQTLGIKGGITEAGTATSGENVITRTDADGNINIELAKDATFDSITTGNTVMNNAGVKVGDKVFLTEQGLQAGDTFITSAGLTFNNSTVAVTAGGINAGGNKITNVADGSEASDAVNYGQLEKGLAAAKTEVKAGKNIVVTEDSTDPSVYIVETEDDVDFDSVTSADAAGNKTVLNKEGVAVVDKEGNEATYSAAGVNVKDRNGNTTNIAATQITVGGNNPIVMNGNSGMITGLTNQNWSSSSFADGSGRAATEEQLKPLGDFLGFENGNYTFSYNGKDHKNLAEALDSIHWNVEAPDAGGNTAGNTGGGTGGNSGSNNSGSDTTSKTPIANTNTVGFKGDGNLTVSKTERVDSNGDVIGADIQYTLNKDIKVDSITAINVNATNVTANEVTINNGPVINQDGIDMRDKQITNVADGVGPKDAVNVSQLENVKNDLHTEIGGVRRDLHKVDRKLRAGIAAAMATAALPQAYLPGKSMVGIGGGTWNGESGVALGVSTITDNGKWVFKFSGNASTRGDYGGTVGAGYQW